MSQKGCDNGKERKKETKKENGTLHFENLKTVAKK
jgi:hypothetical protein